MPALPTTTGILIDLTSDLVRLLADVRQRGVLDATLSRELDARSRRIARLACRVDAQRRAAVGLLGSGRIPRDVAATLIETMDDDEAA
jgi:hypothetical protein